MDVSTHTSMIPATAALAGLVAGAAVAVPLGAIGVLVIRRGVLGGTRPAIGAAAGVAFVDVVYCVIAVSVGAVAAPVVESWGDWPRAIGGVVLLVLGVAGIVTAVRGEGTRVDLPNDGDVAPRRNGVGVRRSFVEFVALTAINPMTLLYFAGVTTALGTALADAWSAAAFVAGVGVASLAWQSVLATTGVRLGRRLGRRGVRVLSTIGAAIVLLLGVGALGSVALRL